VLEAEPLRRLRFDRADVGMPDQRAEFSIVFESTETGSRFTVTRHGFGAGEVADAFADANFLGFSHGFADLIFYLETGKAARRHYLGCNQSSTAMLFKERAWGVEVLDVTPGGFAAQAGLERGDRILRIGGVPIYTRNDVWGLTTEHAPETLLSVEYVRGRERRHATARLSKPELAAVGE
jgi:membrane-associated protease RseP (regulator of RpoE activity)